ncbi:intermembrane phospholipid transport protein YdbH family protein [Pseudoalteromonas luteoviolacea]|uniref:Dicarboxylate transport domain-containing protein n=1 Tax=Pseudoalteromonas luteoviolacea S4060-1 TaxID=1365257 RepID=A0A167I830_9GAMM|nr:YdbH domain-containing protein [Pseudoalteromonas luteoviolacea]KZN59025.1 hypothetical protein N478_09345 [Pseudoalteromonas luteoviolacea S4060-1]
MRRNFIFAAMALLFVVFITFVFRVPLSLAVAKHYLPQGQLTCLDWSLSGIKEVTVDEVCFESDDILVLGKGITISTERLDADSLSIAHKGAQKDAQESEMQTLNLPLPKRRPLVNVAHLDINSPLLKRPLHLSIKETQLNQFEVAGELVAHIEMSPFRVKSQVELHSAAIAHYLPEQVHQLSGTFNLSTDGVMVKYETEVELSAYYQKDNRCQVDIVSKGQLSGSWHLNDTQGEVNASRLPLQLDASRCADFINAQSHLPNGMLSSQWVAAFDSNLEISQAEVLIPQLTLSDSHSDSEVQVHAFTMNYNNLAAKGRLDVNHHSDVFGLVALQSSFLYEPLSTRISGDWIVSNASLSLPSHLKLTDLVSQGAFTLAGDPLQALTLEVNAQFTASEVNVQDIQLDNTELNIDSTSVIHLTGLGTQHALPIQINEINTLLSAQKYKLQTLSGKHVLLQTQAELSKSGDLLANTELDIGSFKMRGIRGKDINQTSIISGKVTSQKINASIDGEMHLGLIANPNLSFRDAVLTTSGSIQDTVKLKHIAHLEDFELSIDHILDGELNQVLLNVPEQSFMALQPFVSQLAPQLQLSEGFISAEVAGDLATQSYQFKADLKGGGVLYDSHYLHGINLPITGNFDNGQLALSETVLDIAEVRSGAVLTDVSAKLSSMNNTLILSDARATIFDGEITAQKFNLSKGDQRFSIEAHNWDLALISEAGKNAGVELRGRVSGKLPVSIEQSALEITNGKLTNVDVGFLSIENNESVEALKSHQAGIDTAFSLLENLEIEKLSSDVALSPDGWLDLAVEIVGVNEQAQQPINFNYTHSENIFQLFRALRLSDEITNEVEKALNK